MGSGLSCSKFMALTLMQSLVIKNNVFSERKSLLSVLYTDGNRTGSNHDCMIAWLEILN